MDATKAQVTIIAEEEKPAKKIEDDEDDLKEQLLQTIDKITAELHGRFDDESKSILNSLATICFDEDVEKNVFLLSLNKCFHQLPFHFLHCHLTGQKLIKTGSREENTVKNSTNP